MIRQMPLAEFREEMIPQAVLGRPTSYFAEHFGLDFETGEDDLDAYEGVGIRFDDIPVTLVHYQGYPESTVTVYLPRRFDDVGEITKIVRALADAFHLPSGDLIWQRADDPDL